MRQEFVWKLPRAVINLGTRTAVMGILNVTPDSFSDPGEYFEREKAIAHAKEMEQEGADIIDIGGESTRPGSEPVAEEEEVRRVIPVIEALAGFLKIPMSVDTYRAGVARRAIEAGAEIVNDISGFRLDDSMPAVVAKSRAGVVLMHSRGERGELHKQSRMHEPLKEVYEGLTGSIGAAVRAGVPNDAIVIDPGIGFGKDASESLMVLRNLNDFSKLGCPLLIGTSRKSFIRSITQDSSEARAWGTAATVVVSIMNGAHIVRVHDVRHARVLADVVDRLI